MKPLTIHKVRIFPVLTPKTEFQEFKFNIRNIELKPYHTSNYIYSSSLKEEIYFAQIKVNESAELL